MYLVSQKLSVVYSMLAVRWIGLFGLVATTQTQTTTYPGTTTGAKLDDQCDGQDRDPNARFISHCSDRASNEKTCLQLPNLGYKCFVQTCNNGDWIGAPCAKVTESKKNCETLATDHPHVGGFERMPWSSKICVSDHLKADGGTMQCHPLNSTVVTYAEAKTHCETAGARLCTSDEYKSTHDIVKAYSQCVDHTGYVLHWSQSACIRWGGRNGLCGRKIPDSIAGMKPTN